MRKALLVGSLVAGTVILTIAIAMPFFLPAPIYELVYGWRYPKQWQVGDGLATDAGPVHATRRYTIDLADLRRPDVTSLKLQITSLPEVELTMGFEVHASSPNDAILDTKPITAVAHLQLVNERGQVVIDQRAPLDRWVWSGAVHEKSRSFVYARGEQRETPVGAGTVRVERAHIKADDGWGTYFVPRHDGQYTITLDIHGHDPKGRFDDFRLVAYGGGWK